MTLEDLIRLPAHGTTNSELQHSLRSIEDYLRAEYYPWVQSACPFFTDHGERHIAAVTASANALLATRLAQDEITPVEAYVLLVAILHHDSAMVLGRRGHEKKAAAVVESLKALIPEPTLRRLIKEIIQAHTGVTALGHPRVKERVSLHGTTLEVRPRALAAVLRLADEISESRERISLAQLPTVPDASRLYWEYAKTVTASAPLSEYDLGVDYELELEDAVAVWPCSDRKLAPDGNIALIEYIASRMEKLNRERAYCCSVPEGLLRHARVRALVTITRAGERMEGFDGDVVWLGDRGLWLEAGEYPEIPCASGFFSRLPKYRTDALRGMIQSP